MFGRSLLVFVSIESKAVPISQKLYMCLNKVYRSLHLACIFTIIIIQIFD